MINHQMCKKCDQKILKLLICERILSQNIISPLLLFFKWGETKVISGVAAAFILVNSISGLMGVLIKTPMLPSALPYWVAAAILGGLIGAEFGSRHFSNPSIRKVLALVLLLAGSKMVLSG